ncbi:MAG: Firmicu-CTERM sorting domain-containing protein [Lachnospiraceae bacterium]
MRNIRERALAVFTSAIVITSAVMLPVPALRYDVMAETVGETTVDMEQPVGEPTVLENNMTNHEGEVPQETTAAQETSASEETAAAQETSASEETTAAQETSAPQETTAAQEATAPQETTAVQETSAPQETKAPQETTAVQQETSATQPATKTQPTVPAVQNGSVSSYKMTKDAEFIYLTFDSAQENEWDSRYLSMNTIEVIYKDASLNSGRTAKIQFTNMSLKDAWYGDIPDSLIQIDSKASGTASGSVRVTCRIPLSYFSAEDFSIKFAGNETPVADIESIVPKDPAKETEGTTAETESSTGATNPAEPTKPVNKEPVYTGITLDGNFSDWDAIPKAEMKDSSAEHSYLFAAAMVYDGDYVYIYLEDAGDLSATMAGDHSNGMYALTTDLGYTTIFQLTRNNGGSVAGVDGASCSRNGNQWEIAIPAGALPKNNGSVSFGLYLSDPVVSATNLNPGTGNVAGEFNGVVYDGLYGDWAAYPHTTIQYATSGTQEGVVDAEAALYAGNDGIYGHVVTMMSVHRAQAGGEFTSAVGIRLNSDLYFWPNMVAVDAAGNINWNPQKSGLPEGTYEFYMVDSQGWGGAPNINDMPGNAVYGKMMITIGASSDETEFVLDPNALAQKFGIDATDIKTVEANFGRIGHQWVETAGASTGSWLGILLCLGMTGVVLYRRKKEVI